MTTHNIKPCLLKIYSSSRFFSIKTWTLFQYRYRPEIILNSVLKYNLKNKQILRPNPKTIYIIVQQISIDYLFLYKNDYQTYEFCLSEKSKINQRAYQQKSLFSHHLYSFSSYIFSSMSEWLFCQKKKCNKNCNDTCFGCDNVNRLCDYGCMLRRIMYDRISYYTFFLLKQSAFCKKNKKCNDIWGL